MSSAEDFAREFAASEVYEPWTDPGRAVVFAERIRALAQGVPALDELRMRQFVWNLGYASGTIVWDRRFDEAFRVGLIRDTWELAGKIARSDWSESGRVQRALIQFGESVVEHGDFPQNQGQDRISDSWFRCFVAALASGNELSQLMALHGAEPPARPSNRGRDPACERELRQRRGAALRRDRRALRRGMSARGDREGSPIAAEWRAYHPSRPAEEVTVALGLTPHRSIVAGDPSSVPELGPIPEHGWFRDLSAADNEDVWTLVRGDLDTISARSGAVEALRAGGWGLELLLARTLEGGTMEVPADVAEGCEAMGIRIIHSVF